MDGRTLKFLNVIDEFSRVCLAIRVGRRCKAVDVIDTIEELLKLYPPPTHLRMNNGPEFIAHALQEWCTGSGTGTAYIPPGSPWENQLVESFNGRFRVEFLNIELFASLQEAKLLTVQHRFEYNVYRPLSALIRTRAAKGVTSRVDWAIKNIQASILLAEFPEHPWNLQNCKTVNEDLFSST